MATEIHTNDLTAESFKMAHHARIKSVVPRKMITTALFLTTFTALFNRSFASHKPVFVSQPDLGTTTRRLQRYMSDEEDQFSEKSCVKSGQCEFCGREDEGCLTGRKIRFDCVDELGNTRSVYRNCDRTPMEEEWGVLKFQIFCVAFGMFSLRSTRKRKIAYASLFDQRRNGNTKTKRRSSMDPGPTDLDDVSIDSDSEESESLLGKSKADNV